MLIGNGHCADSSENPTQQSVQQAIFLGKLLKQHSFGKTRENHLLAQSHLLEPHFEQVAIPSKPMAWTFDIVHQASSQKRKPEYRTQERLTIWHEGFGFQSADQLIIGRMQP